MLPVHAIGLPIVVGSGSASRSMARNPCEAQTRPIIFRSFHLKQFSERLSAPNPMKCPKNPRELGPDLQGLVGCQSRGGCLSRGEPL